MTLTSSSERSRASSRGAQEALSRSCSFNAERGKRGRDWSRACGRCSRAATLTHRVYLARVSGSPSWRSYCSFIVVILHYSPLVYAYTLPTHSYLLSHDESVRVLVPIILFPMSGIRHSRQRQRQSRRLVSIKRIVFSIRLWSTLPNLYYSYLFLYLYNNYRPSDSHEIFIYSFLQ